MNALLLLCGAGLLAGAMNAIAGGGSFITLPALIAAGVPSVEANASSTVALYPGGLASAWTYHDSVETVCGVPLSHLLAVTLAGGLAGSALLLWTSSAAFMLILPWLLLLATVALAFGHRIGERLRGHFHVRSAPVLLMQFLLGVYGGYFGGAVGIMMMAFWTVLGERDLKTLNGPRTLLVSAANTVAALAFIVAGAVRWPETLVLIAGGLAGGYAGARLGRVLPHRVARALTLCCSWSITGAFFAHAYL
jgi:uncharacterized membrane protein YfcA